MLLSIPKDKLVRSLNKGAGLIDSTNTKEHTLIIRRKTLVWSFLPFLFDAVAAQNNFSTRSKQKLCSPWELFIKITQMLANHWERCLYLLGF